MSIEETPAFTYLDRLAIVWWEVKLIDLELN
jgi:hypothetical protein